MYIPIAFYKNSLVLIDNMDTFALYFCSSVKQKMRSAPESPAGYDGDGIPSEHDSDEEISGGAGFASEDSFVEALDDDDDL